MTILYEMVKRMVLPLNLILLLLMAGLALVWWKFNRLGRVMLILGILLLYMFSISPTADLLFKSLESAHEPLSPKRVPRIGTLVVLSGGASATADLPASSRLTQGSIKRLLEAVRLYRLMNRPTIVLSGGSGNPIVNVSESEVMRELLLDLGIPAKRITIEGKSRDTYENARAVKQLQLKRPLILITSAAHMPRALKIFGALGMRPLPAPSDFRSGLSAVDPLRFIPSAGSLANSTSAIYEYFGTWWYDLMDRF